MYENLKMIRFLNNDSSFYIYIIEKKSLSNEIFFVNKASIKKIISLGKIHIILELIYV